MAVLHLAQNQVPRRFKRSDSVTATLTGLYEEFYALIRSAVRGVGHPLLHAIIAEVEAIISLEALTPFAEDGAETSQEI